jgi:hypothetical protein
MATEKQIAANRANAQKSSGPTSEAGRQRASLNALRHGLTGQVTVMPNEDRQAFNTFCAEIVASLNPANALEQQLAQSVAQDNWRLNRARAMEDNILALGHSSEAAEMDAEHPEIHAAVTAARVFSADPAQFQLLTLYMQRSNRDIHRNIHLLRELQTERRAARKAEFEQASRLKQLNEMKEVPYEPKAEAAIRGMIAGDPLPPMESVNLSPRNSGNANGHWSIGFVFSTHEIDVYTHHQRRLRQADHAQYRNWDRKTYEADGYSLAA